MTKLLNGKGYPIARRTVAKYREMIGSPVARLSEKALMPGLSIIIINYKSWLVLEKCIKSIWSQNQVDRNYNY